MSIHVCECLHNGNKEFHLCYPGMPEAAAQEMADRINAGALRKFTLAQEFTKDQWWYLELDAIAKTDKQRRAMAVIRNLLKQIAPFNPAETKEPSQEVPAIALNKETQDQIAAVMLLHGTPEQQNEALRHASYVTRKAAPCLHSFFTFGDQKRRRCNWCNEFEPLVSIEAKPVFQPFPEPSGVVIGFQEDGNAIVDHPCEGPYKTLEEGDVLYAADAVQDIVKFELGNENVKSTGQVYGIIDPDYGRAYTIIRKVAWDEGYAIGLHGSFTRDLDLIAVPWRDGKGWGVQHLVNRIKEHTGLVDGTGNPHTKPNGRKVWTLMFPGSDPRFVDLSIFEPLPPKNSDQEYEAVMKQWDFWRKEIACGDTGSGPRDWFESVLLEGASRFNFATPAAEWRQKGEPDPHGSVYDCERATLALGSMSDEALANGAFMNYDVRPPVEAILAGLAHSPIAWMTAVKDRIRWLSRRLVEAERAAKK